MWGRHGNRGGQWRMAASGRSVGTGPQRAIVGIPPGVLSLPGSIEGTSSWEPNRMLIVSKRQWLKRV